MCGFPFRVDSPLPTPGRSTTIVLGKLHLDEGGRGSTGPGLLGRTSRKGSGWDRWVDRS